MTPPLPPRHRRRPTATAIATAVATLVLASLPGPAAAQSQETPQGQRGAARIISIQDNGRFNRCAAHFDSAAGPLRISWNRDRVYNISTPAVPLNGQLLLTLVDTPGGTITMDAITNGQRVSARMDSATVEAVLRIRGRIVVRVASRRFEYALGNASMEDIMVEVENCTHRGLGRR